MSRTCLDSWAVLRWLEGREPTASEVDAQLVERPLMSWINLGEVAYITRRAMSADGADRVVLDLRSRLDLDDATPRRVLEAARVKADHPMAYGDAFAVATAIAHSAVLWTGDPEIIDAETGCEVRDLR
ncbi:MAG: type II toxin-antitoxin system VapC family toxin [Ilumatobacteraceae bacterium]